MYFWKPHICSNKLDVQGDLIVSVFGNVSRVSDRLGKTCEWVKTNLTTKSM